MAALKHIEHIGDTDVNIYGNLDTLQIAIQTNSLETLVWANSGASKFQYAAIQYSKDSGGTITYADNDFGQVTLHDDLLVDEYIKRSGGTDDRIRFENDKITIDAGGATAMVFEDDKIYTALDVGIGITTPFSRFTGTESGLEINNAGVAYIAITGATAAVLNFAATSATSGAQVFDILSNAGTLSFRNLSDDSSTTNTTIMTMAANGNVAVNTGDLNLLTGDFTVTAGDAIITAGDLTVTAGSAGIGRAVVAGVTMAVKTRLDVLSPTGSDATLRIGEGEAGEVNTDYGQFHWDRTDDAFYVSTQNAQGVIKISDTDGSITLGLADTNVIIKHQLFCEDLTTYTSGTIEMLVRLSSTGEIQLAPQCIT